MTLIQNTAMRMCSSEYEPGHCVGLIKLAGMEINPGKLLGRKADLKTPQELSRYFRDDVLRQAKIQCDA